VESVVLSLIALIIAVFLARLFLPWLNELSQRNLTINFTNNKIIFFIMLFGILTGILSGLYPAILFSKYKPVQMIHSRVTILVNKIGFRNGFIIVQFIITILLIISQLFITKQVLFMKNHDLGFNEQDLMSIPLYTNEENKRQAFAKLFAENLQNGPASYGIRGITISENVPGQNFPNKFAVIPEGALPEDSKEMVVTSIDESFTNVFQIPLISGRILSDTIASDRFNNVLINETAVLKFGWDNPVGKKIRFKHENKPVTVVGVLKDINFKSLHTPVEPVVYRYAGEYLLISYITIRIDHKYSSQAIKFINATWDKLASDVPFQYFFIKDKYIEKYKGEERLAKIVGTFAIIAILLSCLGLFALIACLSIRRTKEIGIRKINGAKIIEIIILLNKDFLRLIAIAFAISCPIAWYIMSGWVQSFAYRTKLSWWIYALSGIIVLGITLLTVSGQSWRAAKRNPVEALRYE